ncbi:MAG: hypothetical protein J7K39_10105 [Bacteroidales bacterium]|nr:hypothetical protein [Bacteroidales bacterium]
MKTKNNKKLNLNFLIILTMTLSLAFLASCEKTDETLDLTAEEALAQVQDEALATALFDEVIEIGEEAEAADNTKSTEISAGYRLSECTTITREYNEDSRVITIDFGEENCEGADGKLRRGKIIIERTGFYFWSEVTATYTFDNYFVDDNQLTGTKTYTGSFNEDGTYSSTFITDGSIILADGSGTITWQSERNRLISEGADTWGFADNRVEVTGFSNGVTSDGIAFSSEIIEPLIRIYQEGCFRFYVAGIVKINKADGTEILINYGDGTCDNLAEVTIDGVTEIIELGTRILTDE